MCYNLLTLSPFAGALNMLVLKYFSWIFHTFPVVLSSSFISYPPQIVTDQQTGQKIQIVTAMNPSSAPKQQFILTTADSSGAGKVILASPDSHNAKQLIFTAADSLMPGRIQVHFPLNTATWGICDNTTGNNLFLF